MKFKEIFEAFLDNKPFLKVLSVASVGKDNEPNCAPKMIIDVISPNRIYLIEYKFTRTYGNIAINKKLSVSFMDDVNFRGYRLNGSCEIIEAGKEYDSVKAEWDKRLIKYEAERILKRTTGLHSARDAENVLPRDFVIIRFEAREGSFVEPDRVIRAIHRDN